MTDQRMQWALPIMRLGYAGRGLTYVAIAGLSLWAIWQGGQAQGTSEVLEQIETSPMGAIVLMIIGVGLLCYTLWRLLSAWADLENYGQRADGLIARGGMITTGLIHAAIGIGAIILVFEGQEDDYQRSHIIRATEMVMAVPFGVWLVGIAGALTCGAGLYYLHKAWSQSYRDHLAANHFTSHWNRLLQAGVAAQGIVILIVSMFLMYAFWTHDPDQAGGLDKTFDWLAQQVFGQVLVTGLCFGLLGFALFLFVNARYRIVPGLSDPDLKSLADIGA